MNDYVITNLLYFVTTVLIIISNPLTLRSQLHLFLSLTLLLTSILFPTKS